MARKVRKLSKWGNVQVFQARRPACHIVLVSCAFLEMSFFPLQIRTSAPKFTKFALFVKFPGKYRENPRNRKLSRSALPSENAPNRAYFTHIRGWGCEFGGELRCLVFL